MTTNTFDHIPRENEVVRVPSTKNGNDIKPYIASALRSDAVKAAIEPHVTGEGREGGKIADQVRAADIIVAHDLKHGGNIASRRLPIMVVVNQLYVVLRRDYIVVKGKIVGLNPKALVAIAAPEIEAPAA